MYFYPLLACCIILIMTITFTRNWQPVWMVHNQQLINLSNSCEKLIPVAFRLSALQLISAADLKSSTAPSTIWSRSFGRSFAGTPPAATVDAPSPAPSFCNLLFGQQRILRIPSKPVRFLLQQVLRPTGSTPLRWPAPEPRSCSALL